MPFNSKLIHRIKHLLFSSGCLIIIFFLPGCSLLSLQTDPGVNRGAFEAASRIRQMNQDINSCKGSAWLHTGSPSQKQTFRLAYAAKPPDRIRLTLLSSGHPVETVLADGRSVTFISHTGEHQTTTYDSNDISLNDIFSIPIRISDIIRLLSGQIPLQEFNYAKIITTDEKSALLELGKNMITQKQQLVTGTDGFPVMLERFDAKGNSLFSIHFEKFSDLDSKTIAATFSIMDKSGRTATIDITSFQADIPINDTVFRLTELR